jgi:hypothetical protein
MPDKPQLPTFWTVGALARLVKALRDTQKAGGLGYKTAAQTTAAAALEKQVDAAVAQIEKNHRL